MPDSRFSVNQQDHIQSHVKASCPQCGHAFHTLGTVSGVLLVDYGKVAWMTAAEPLPVSPGMRPPPPSRAGRGVPHQRTQFYLLPHTTKAVLYAVRHGLGSTTDCIIVSTDSRQHNDLQHRCIVLIPRSTSHLTRCHSEDTPRRRSPALDSITYVPLDPQRRISDWCVPTPKSIP